MNENIHNEESFKKAYRELEESPSPEVWDKISARLDNIDSVHHGRRFVAWMRVACVLLLLAGGAGAYEIFNHKNDSAVKTASKDTVHQPGSEVTISEQLSTDSSI